MENGLTKDSLEEKIEELKLKLKKEIKQYNNRFGLPAKNEIERKSYAQRLARVILEDEKELKKLIEQKGERDAEKQKNGFETESQLLNKQAQSPEKLSELVQKCEKLQNELKKLKNETGVLIDVKTGSRLEKQDKLQELINEQSKMEDEIAFTKRKITQCIEQQKKALITVTHKNKFQLFWDRISLFFGKEGRTMRKAVWMTRDNEETKITDKIQKSFHAELVELANMVIEDERNVQNAEIAQQEPHQQTQTTSFIEGLKVEIAHKRLTEKNNSNRQSRSTGIMEKKQLEER